MTKRTRKRNPKPKPPPPAPDASKVDLAADQLAVLWDRLQHATARDAAGLGSSDGRSSGANVHAAVVNVDVVEALGRIRSELADTVAQAEALLGITRRRRTVPDTISKLGDWHRSLEARQQPLARDIEHDVRRWEGIARRALGLDTHGRDLGELCPFHRDDEPTPLLVDPDRATLHEALLSGQQPVDRDDGGRVVRDADGRPSRQAPVRWKYSDRVSCSHCKRSWSGLQELRVLGNLLRDNASTASSDRDRGGDVEPVPDGATQDGWRYDTARQWWIDPEIDAVAFATSATGRYLRERWEAGGGLAAHRADTRPTPPPARPHRVRPAAYGGGLRVAVAIHPVRPRGAVVLGRAGRCDRCDLAVTSCSCPAGPLVS